MENETATVPWELLKGFGFAFFSPIYEIANYKHMEHLSVGRAK